MHCSAGRCYHIYQFANSVVSVCKFSHSVQHRLYENVVFLLDDISSYSKTRFMKNENDAVTAGGFLDIHQVSSSSFLFTWETGLGARNKDAVDLTWKERMSWRKVILIDCV